MKKKLISLLMTVVLVLSISVPASAVVVDGDDAQVAIPASEIQNNVNVTYEDGAMIINCAIYQETTGDNARIKYYVPVGEVDFELRPLLGNGVADARWRIELMNGDYIKGVTGTFYLWKDVLGPFNNFLDSATVNEYYQYDAMLGARQSMEALRLDESEVDYDTAIIFEWEDFEVQGGAANYVIFDGNQQGDLRDFPLSDD